MSDIVSWAGTNELAHVSGSPRSDFKKILSAKKKFSYCLRIFSISPLTIVGLTCRKIVFKGCHNFFWMGNGMWLSKIFQMTSQFYLGWQAKPSIQLEPSTNLPALNGLRYNQRLRAMHRVNGCCGSSSGNQTIVASLTTSLHANMHVPYEV